MQEKILCSQIIRRPDRFYKLIKLELQVMDVNDNAPSFSSEPLYSINISETTPIESHISLDHILATDKDMGK